MPTLKTYDLFISHAWDYSDEYRRLVALLTDAPNFYWRNYSVPEHDRLPGVNLNDELRRQIRPVNAALIIGGMYYNHRDWIQFEVDVALASAKPIIVVRPWGSQVLPTELQRPGMVDVGWNGDSITAAVRRHAL